MKKIVMSFGYDLIEYPSRMVMHLLILGDVCMSEVHKEERSHDFINFVFLQFTSFHSFHGLMNSINWPALHVLVFIAQLVEHCSANTAAEATGSNPVKALKNFFGATSQLHKLRLELRWSHLHFQP